MSVGKIGRLFWEVPRELVHLSFIPRLLDSEVKRMHRWLIL